MIPITKQDDYHMRRPQVGEARTTQSYRIYMCLYSIYYILHRKFVLSKTAMVVRNKMAAIARHWKHS